MNSEMLTIFKKYTKIYLITSSLCLIINSFLDIRYNIYQSDYSYSFFIPFIWIFLSIIGVGSRSIFSKEYKNYKLYIKNNYPELYQKLWRQGRSGLVYGKNINFIKLKYDDGSDPIINSVRNIWALQNLFTKEILICFLLIMFINIIFMLTLR
jgi:hypothetical protein